MASRVAVEYLCNELGLRAIACRSLDSHGQTVVKADGKVYLVTTGFGGKKDLQRAYSLLKPLTSHADFAKNGAFAYAFLLEKKIGGNASLLDIMHYYATAANVALQSDERTTARERCNQLYEKYYQ